MMRFKCIYCGQRIVAREETVGKRGKCPKCSHVLRVPWTMKGRPGIGGYKDESLEQHTTSGAKSLTSSWGHFADYAPDDLIIGEKPTINFVYLYGEKAGWLIPTYDELSLFLMAATLLLLFATNTQMREDIHSIRTMDENLGGRPSVLMLLCIVGFYLCLYHVFTLRKKTEWERRFMLLFAVTANATTGIAAGIHLIRGSAGWQLVFPIWNIINGVLLLLMLRLKIINEDCISDHNATPGQVIFGLIAVLIIFALCNFLFELYWALTFSICVIYATNFDRALQSIFPGRADSATAESS